MFFIRDYSLHMACHPARAEKPIPKLPPRRASQPLASATPNCALDLQTPGTQASSVWSASIGGGDGTVGFGRLWNNPDVLRRWQPLGSTHSRLACPTDFFGGFPALVGDRGATP